MAEYGIRRLRIPPANVALEPRATSTRENIEFALPWLREAGTIRIASNTFHARRARGYLRELDPALWHRLAPTRDHVLLELGPLRLALTFYDWVAARTAARREVDSDPGRWAAASEVARQLRRSRLLRANPSEALERPDLRSWPSGAREGRHPNPDAALHTCGTTAARRSPSRSGRRSSRG